ncbi:hypothetical protein [Neomicrococcus lactis]|nr:hypothetical protein [Neomicrococcus lactis]
MSRLETKRQRETVAIVAQTLSQRRRSRNITYVWFGGPGRA